MTNIVFHIEKENFLGFFLEKSNNERKFLKQVIVATRG